MDLDDIVLSKLSQRKTNTVLFYLYVESKNKQMNKHNKTETVIDTENKPMVVRWW